MRILVYGINFAPELTGIGKYTGEMAVFLAENGHQVRVITTPPYYPYWYILPGYSGRAYSREVWRGVEVFRCPLWVPPRRAGAGRISGPQRLFHLASFALSSFPTALGQIGWRPERVIVMAPAILNAPTALLVARLAGGKAWLHIQDFELDAARRLRMLPAMELVYRLAGTVEGALYHGFDRVSTISKRMMEHLARKGVASRHAVLFPNWVDTRQIHPLSGYNYLRDELGLENKRVMLYAGNMGQKQGLEILVEAARRLTEHEDLLFLLCGAGAARPQLEKLAKGLANVRFLPLQPAERLNELLNLAEIHILPQAAEAADLVMPSKLGGMLASGRPVIVTAQTGTELAEVMRDLGRVVPPERPDLLAEAILALAGQPEIQAELGRRGRAYVERTWAKETVLEEFLQTLQAL
jgi:colanic acid biosynthesis glycosyl transferase WcaI